MTQENLSEKMITNFVDLNGIGTVALRNGGYRDVFVYGYFRQWNWDFIVHSDIDEPQFVTVSEASTGRRLCSDVYYTVEDALYYTIPLIRTKRYYFATAVGDTLVKTKCNLRNRNSTNLQTLAIDIFLW